MQRVKLLVLLLVAANCASFAQIRNLPVNKKVDPSQTVDRSKTKPVRTTNTTTTTTATAIEPSLYTLQVMSYPQPLTLQYATQPFTATPEMIRALNWWRSINPSDVSNYLSPFKLATHTLYDTTVEKFITKQSLGFKGWLYKEGWSNWRSDSLVHLLPMKNLIQIDLPSTFVNDTAFRYLGRLHNLRAIYYHSGTAYFSPNTAVTNTGLRLLLQNPNLEFIGFQNLSAITDAGFEVFRNRANLKVLYTMGWKGISNNALLSLQGCTALEQLYLIDSNISDEGLYNLLSLRNSLPNLRRVYLHGSPVSFEAINSFRDKWGNGIEVLSR